MKKGLTELVFILDKSGSMSGLEGDTMGGYNSMLKKQRDLEGECYMTTVLFSNQVEVLHDRINIQAVAPMTEEDYQVGGGTALIDAMGSSIAKIKKVQASTHEDYRAEQVLFVIITDGEENSSRHFSSDKIKEDIESLKKEGWDFIFLGANIDAVETAKQFGIDADRAETFQCDSEGVARNFEVLSSVVCAKRSAVPIAENWSADISLHGKK